MLFHTAEFALFLAVVLAVFYSAPLGLRRFVLLGSSYLFYMFWNPYFIVLLVALTAIDYGAALWIAQSSGRGRKLALGISLAANLGFLGFFKYTNFFIDNVAWLMGVPPAGYHLALILPLGISFHTFQSISYVVDVYRGQQEPIRSPIDYALFIAFFPQLVAGPIVRASEFFPDLHHWQAPSRARVQEAAAMIVTGVVKKLVLADQFAAVADGYFGAVAATPGTPAAWSATIAFAAQIFFDFSGYTDIAIGTAALFGFHFPMNFRRPYLAASITGFWRRWHMSLSRWLRHYVYIPLGGNRGGTLATYRNLILTMLIGGLWHGASWNFVLWGGYHGVLLAAERALGIGAGEGAAEGAGEGAGEGSRKGAGPGQALGLWPRVLRAVPVFALVCVSWVFFRARTLADTTLVLQRMFGWQSGAFLLQKRHIAFLAVTLLLALAEEARGWVTRLGSAPAWAQAAALALVLACIEIFGVTDQSIPFVYFQF
ncbi:MAG TPA: MBOAT family protein [Candidatus Acidoferrales bacterium]|jgi:alginate O-acetyltransferase complex protein AlgI|nr:MBOAT family protein [Candidatus Acidoferrales bacterium]